MLSLHFSVPSSDTSGTFDKTEESNLIISDDPPFMDFAHLRMI